MTTALKEKPKKEPEPKTKEPETAGKPKAGDFKIRHLTEEETKMLMDDDSLPEGYANVVPEAALEEPPEKKPEEKETVKKEPEPVKEEPKGAPEPEDHFVKIERELQKPEGKENLTNFTPREKAYFSQMRRDRKTRQIAEEDRDKAPLRLSENHLPLSHQES